MGVRAPLTWFGALMVTAALIQPALERHTYQRVVMGAPCTITLYAPNKGMADRAADSAFTSLDHVDRTLSDWSPTSEASGLPLHAGTRAPVSSLLALALTRSQEFWSASEGAFDPTIAPVSWMWRTARQRGVPPDAHHIAAAMQQVGMSHIQMGQDAEWYMTDIPGVRLDFGGIGQGLGLAQAALALRSQGIRSALIDLSGDLTALQPPPHTEGWRVWVPCIQSMVLLANASLTVSGDEFQHLDAPAPDAPTRFSHIIDPRTGWAIPNSQPVVVVAPDPVEADALATALSVLGPTRSTALLAKYPQAQAIFGRATPGDQE
jgi:thiamine biosynthesis lipoprotein